MFKKKANFIYPSVLVLAACNFGAPQLQAVLEKIGLEKSDIDAIVALPEDAKDFKPEDFVSKVSSSYETRFINDPNFLGKLKPEQLPENLRKTVEAGQYGRFMNEFKALATKQGIDLADLSEDDLKSLNKTASAAFEKFKGKLGSPEAVTQLQTQLQAALADKTKLETELPTKVSSEVGKVEAKYTAQITKLIAANELAAIKGLKVKPALVVDSLLNSLGSQYTLITQDNGIILRQKENKELKALGADGKELTFQQALKNAAVENELISEQQQQQQQDPNQGRVTVKVDGNDVLPDYIKNKIQANLDVEGKK